MRAFGKLMPFEDALKLAMEAVKPIDRKEKLKLGEALDRVISEELISPMNVPGYTRAAMDGYALISADSTSASDEFKVSLRITAEIFAGEAKHPVLSAGETFKIATGGMLPEGADAVVPFEDIEEQLDTILIDKPIEAGSCLGLEGEDIKIGETVLQRGTFLHAGHIGAAASIGIGELECYEKPVVAIGVSGDEIALIGEPLGPGEVYDTNSYTLSAVVNRSSGVAEKLPIVRDSVEQIEDALSSSNADILTFTGGSSVGEKDLIVDAVRNLGEVIFHGVTVKPGKPTLLGKVGDKLVLGMPGYPTSCLTIASILLSPMLRKMSRTENEFKSNLIEATLAETLTSKPGSHQVIPVKLTNGTAKAVFKGSSVITSMSNADGYVEMPAGISEIREGEKVTVTLL